MPFNLFGPASIDDIRVGYVDPVLGYINNVSICEANTYAKNNPGTIFIFVNGNNEILYLTINDVNKLTTTDIVSTKKDECGGIQTITQCGPPEIQIFGGDGIGAVGNPVIGRDGSLLAVDIVRSGHGYKFPPLVAARDECQFGSGAVLTSVLGETADSVEIFADEDDFEEYFPCPDTEVGYGINYGPNGEELGVWDPRVYTSNTLDPIQVEIDTYQKQLEQLQNPFWTTRKNKPIRITKGNGTIVDQSYDVTFDKDWSEFMNTYAISPVKPSEVRGSDNAGVTFTMEWEENFPISGEYIFRGLCDNVATLYVDGDKLFDLGDFKGPVKPVSKTITEGNHTIQVDLLNQIQYETQTVYKTETQAAGSLFIKEGNQYYMLAGGNDIVEIDFTFDWDDNPGVAGYAATKITIPTERGGPVVLKRPLSGSKGSVKATGTFKTNKKYGPIIFEGRAAGSKAPDIVNTGPRPDQRQQRINLFDGGGSDVNAKLTAVNARQLSAARVIPAGNQTSLQSKSIFSTTEYINKANRKLWRVTSAGNDFLSQYGVSPYSLSSKEAQTDSFAGVHVIKWEYIEFPVDGNYRIEIACDDNAKIFIGNASGGGKAGIGNGLKNVNNGGDEVIIKKQGFTRSGQSTGKTVETKFFKAGKYRIRAELEQKDFAPLSKGNPMALGINIEVSTTVEKVVSSKSWYENPFGVAITIDAPEPVPPKEPVPVQEGRCPPNPIWSTRFPSSWIPVRFTGRRESTTTIIPQKETSNLQEVSFKVYGEGRMKRNSNMRFVFTSQDGLDSFVITNVDKNKDKKIEKVKVRKNVVYNVVASVDPEGAKRPGKMEQGLISEKGKNKEAKVKKGEVTGTTIFADFVRSSNDNDDIQISVSNGNGIFKSGKKSKVDGTGRTTFELTYILEGTTTSTPESSIIETTFVPGWSNFMNRYAVSPVKPLPTPGSDSSGTVFRNDWQVDIPYDGFYGIKGAKDDNGRLLIDGVEVSQLDAPDIQNPSLVKRFLTKGRLTITVEVSNSVVSTSSVITKKIFNTKDWQSPLVVKQEQEQPAGSLFVKEGNQYYMLAGGNDIIEIDFTFDWYDDKNFGYAVTKITIPTESKGPVVFSRPLSGTKGSSKATGTFKANKKYGPIVFEGIEPGSRDPEILDTGPRPDQKQQRIIFWDANANDDINNASITATNARQLSPNRTSESIVPVSEKNGVTYSGPPLFKYNEGRWTGFFENAVSPKTFKSISSPDPNVIGSFNLKWSGVEFPESGEYRVTLQADNTAVLKIGGTEVGRSYYNQENLWVRLDDANTFITNVTAGKYDVEIELTNLRGEVDPKIASVFTNNPSGVALLIEKDITLVKTDETPWTKNPMAVSAILIPPPCAKRVGGKGIVERVDVLDPGNGYLEPSGPGYPATLVLDQVIVENPGINYNCGVDELRITPNNGAELEYSCDTFGRINAVKVVNPGIGFDIYPIIEMVTETGVNATFRPIFKVVRDPIAPPEKIIQVTDLVGLKQTRYIDGRPYYGAVYFEKGVKYAGYYATIGEPIRIYDTLQESITGRVTTPPSAIQRSGTDITSNDPRLNIPRTPQDTIPNE